MRVSELGRLTHLILGLNCAEGEILESGKGLFRHIVVALPATTAFVMESVIPSIPLDAPLAEDTASFSNPERLLLTLLIEAFAPAASTLDDPFELVVSGHFGNSGSVSGKPARTKLLGGGRYVYASFASARAWPPLLSDTDPE